MNNILEFGMGSLIKDGYPQHVVRQQKPNMEPFDLAQYRLSRNIKQLRVLPPVVSDCFGFRPIKEVRLRFPTLEDLALNTLSAIPEELWPEPDSICINALQDLIDVCLLDSLCTPTADLYLDCVEEKLASNYALADLEQFCEANREFFIFVSQLGNYTAVARDPSCWCSHITRRSDPGWWLRSVNLGKLD
jgi:hypothetical protein